MVGLLLDIVLTIVIAIVAVVFFGVFRAMPFFTGLIASFVLQFQYPALKDIIPGETRASTIALIAIVELIILVLTVNEQTGGPMVKFSCAMFVGLIMALMHNSYECATWQKALFVTIIYLIIMCIIVASNLDSFGIECDGDRNLLASIIVSIMYAVSLGFTLLVILSTIWGKYVKLHFSEGFYTSYDKVGMVVVIVAMVVTAVASVARDRSELV